MGTVMPPATELVMSVVPRDRGGAGSAITNISRQVAVALGVAVLGSVLAQAYRAQLTPHLSVLPPAARNSAFASIAATQAAAQHLGPAGRSLLAAANQSFVHAMRLTTVISFIIAVLGAVVVAIWMPGRSRAMAPATPAGGTTLAGASPAVTANGAAATEITANGASTAATANGAVATEAAGAER
jgi:hypothetical protein